MSEPARRPPVTLGVRGIVHRLESWKEIAAYLGRSVRTVQRWEARAGLPVYRLDGVGTVYANDHELDTWWEAHRTRLDHEEAAPATGPAATGSRRLTIALGAVAAALGVLLLVDQRPAARSDGLPASPVHPDVREAYLKGRHHFLESATEEKTRKAIDAFERAVREDPGHAPAYAGLARAHLASANLLVPTRAAMAPAWAAARRAISLDSSSAEAHTAQGLLRAALDWDLAGFERDLRRAVQIDPSDARAHLYLGIALILRGRNEPGIVALEKAQQLDPLSVKINARLGMTYAFLGRHEQALAQCRKALDLDTNAAEAHMCTGYALERKGAYRDAAPEYEEAGALGYRAAPHVARVLALAGQEAEARRRLRALEEGRQKGEAWSPYEIAKVRHALGDEDDAFAWLETAYQEHDDTLIALPVEPDWEGVRSDPRFVALARRVGAGG